MTSVKQSLFKQGAQHTAIAKDIFLFRRRIQSHNTTSRSKLSIAANHGHESTGSLKEIAETLEQCSLLGLSPRM